MKKLMKMICLLFTIGIGLTVFNGCGDDDDPPPPPRAAPAAAVAPQNSADKARIQALERQIQQYQMMQYQQQQAKFGGQAPAGQPVPF